MTGDTTYLSKEKYAELKAELEELKTVKRREVAENLEYSKALGDLSENAEYQQARDVQANIEERIIRLENLLKSVEIVTSHHSEKVEIGSTVTVQKGKEKTEYNYQIVGSEEADMAKGKLSNSSPLGTALMGKRKGESLSLSTPIGTVIYKIVSIE
jgi:transcription elongation factor GreA